MLRRPSFSVAALLVCCILAAAGACSDSSKSSPAATGGQNGDAGCVCVANAREACDCAAGQAGTRTCQADCQSWSACSCDDAGDGDSAGSGGDSGEVDATEELDAGVDAFEPEGSAVGGAGGNDGPACDAPSDRCPGLTLELTGTGAEPRVGSATGTTESLCGDYGATCASTFSSPDAVYAITPDIAGSLELDLGGATGTPFDAVLYVRTSCDSDMTEVACGDSAEAGADSVALPVAAGTTYYVFVDGRGGESGTYQLNALLSPVKCGNGVVEGTEACDDGNTLDTDWCKNDCTINTAPAGDDCPGMPLLLAGSGFSPRTALTSGDTSDFTPMFTAAGCSNVVTQAAPDIVFQVTPDVGGSMVARLLPYPQTQFDAVLSVRSDCSSPASELACNDAPNTGTDLVEVPVTPQATYYIIVDGYDASASGPFTLEVTVTP